MNDHVRGNHPKGLVSARPGALYQSLLIPGNTLEEKSRYLRGEWPWIELYKAEHLGFRIDFSSASHLTVTVVKSSGEVFTKLSGDIGPVVVSVSREPENPGEVALESRGLPGIEVSMAVSLMAWLKLRGFEIVTFRTVVFFDRTKWVIPFIESLEQRGISSPDSVLQSQESDIYLTKFMLLAMDFGAQSGEDAGLCPEGRDWRAAPGCGASAGPLLGHRD